MPFGNDTLFFVATSTGLYATKQINGNATVWTQMGQNSIGNVVCEQVKTRALDSLIVVATHGNGIYSSKIKSVDEVLSLHEFTQTYELEAFPNPTDMFLSFTTKEKTPLAIYDINGKQVLYVEQITSSSKINVSKLSEGVYFAKTNQGTVKWVKN